MFENENSMPVDWTVTTSDKSKSKYQAVPSEFIQDIVYLGMVGSGKNLDKRQWTDEFIPYDRAINQACSRLQQRFNKKRSDANIAAKRRRLEERDRVEELRRQEENDG